MCWLVAAHTPVTLLALSALALPLPGQEFEAVSVKPNTSASSGVSTRSDPIMWTATNMSLQRLIMLAYTIRAYQVNGPDWLASARFDIAGKFPQAYPKPHDGPNPALRVMMQKMLVGRFQLATHRETRQLPAYGLVVAKNGPKFHEAQEGCERDQSEQGGRYVGKCVAIGSLVAFLLRNSDLPVINLTGLNGYYNVRFEWTPGERDDSDTFPHPTLTEALEEQLGLKLQERKAPVEVLVVDHIEHTPTGN